MLSMGGSQTSVFRLGCLNNQTVSRLHRLFSVHSRLHQHSVTKCGTYGESMDWYENQAEQLPVGRSDPSELL